ncbi:MAG: Gfo/Idh/MocA family oxidoreductase [Armatimonadota bacterium]|nr:Gfo/Idh/MocA family oxidoreductase [bacterium]MDW8321792.1 Gfo/Idh/MocA family oxidoreductase [Armatimonadota bacterium]
MTFEEWGIGIVGLGGISNVHLQAYRNVGLKVVGGADIDPERVKLMQTKWELPVATTDVESLIAHPEVRIVDVTAPHYLHVREPIFRWAAKYGKALYVQKPLEQYYGNAKKLVQIAQDAGIPLMVNQNSVFVPAFQVMERYLREGAIGTPYYCQIENRNWFDLSAHAFFGKQERWVLSDMGVHHLALAVHWFGSWSSAHAIMGRDPSQNGIVGDTWNVISIRFESGMQACIINNWCYRGHLPRPHPVEEVVIQGDKGAITGTSEDVVIVTADPPAEIRPRFSGRWFPDAFANAMTHYIRSLQEGKPSLCNGRHNLQVVALIEAGYRSVQEGREILRKEIMGDDA